MTQSSELTPSLWSQLLSRTRRWLLRMWRLRGGGFYGLGFVLVFVVHEVRSLFGQVAESTSAADFLTSQALEMVIRLFSESWINFLYAAIWPLLLLGWAGGYGFLMLILGFVVFDRWGKPALNAFFELETEKDDGSEPPP
ncbi:MAG: hypothetical protein AAF918_02315 [Pseudomonadota bacterium]